MCAWTRLVVIGLLAAATCGAEPPAFRFDPAAGAASLAFAAAADAPFRLRLPAISLDGVEQSEFRADGAVAFENDNLRLTFEPVSPRAVALTWIARAGAPHDLAVRLADLGDYYGGGERFHALNQRGYVLRMESQDHPEAKGAISYKPTPFIISRSGYGWWVDSFVPGEFDLNHTDRFHAILRYRTARLRIVFISGPAPAEILAEFTRLTGRVRVPPAWAFAPWKSRDVHRNRDEVLADVELHRRHDLPASVLVIDSPWETGYNDFTLNETQFSEPDALFARVRELGFHPIFWLTPFVNQQNVQDMAGIAPGPTNGFADAKQRGLLVRQRDGSPLLMEWWKGRGALLDFTNPAAGDHWQTLLARTKRWGGRGFKCDDGEGNFIGDAVFFDGSSAAEMRNRYSTLYIEQTRRYIDETLGGDGVLINRSGFTGSQAHAIGWAGDNAATFDFDNGLSGVILAAQNAALSGQPLWGSDIAGYMGTQSKELFVRWTQFAAFTPLMMVHMQSNLGPWDFDGQTLDIYRTYAKLHTQLYPYFNDAAHAAAENGIPVIRPMVLAFPDDAAAAGAIFQFMCGPDLLVAPLFQPGTRRSVYLPRGAWIDYWTGRSFEGPQQLEVDAPLERIPLFVRAGALIEMLPEDVDTLIPRHAEMAADVVAIDDRRVLQVWPGARDTVESKDGLRATRERSDDRETLTLQCDPPRPVEVRWIHRRPRQMKIGAEEATPVAHAGFDALPVEVGREPVVISWKQEND